MPHLKPSYSIKVKAWRKGADVSLTVACHNQQLFNINSTWNFHQVSSSSIALSHQRTKWLKEVLQKPRRKCFQCEVKTSTKCAVQSIYDTVRIIFQTADRILETTLLISPLWAWHNALSDIFSLFPPDVWHMVDVFSHSAVQKSNSLHKWNL